MLEINLLKNKIRGRVVVVYQATILVEEVE